MQAADCSPKETDLPRCDLYRGRDLSGSLAGPYRLISRIGTRGAADVYFGKAAQSGAAQAIVKIVDTLSSPANAVRLFNQERQLIGRFDHPSLARMLDEGTTATGALYLAMEFIDGLPIDEYIKKWSVPGNTAINLFLQICSAVEYLHSVGFTVNDFQSENILVRRAPHAVIADFGSTVPLPATAEDRRFARSLDVHSLGVLLRDSMASVSWPGLRQVLWKATQPAPADRFPTVSDFAQRLQRLL
jgi:serine/threonine protein kinase